MKFSTSLLAWTFALSGMVAATPPGSSIECMFASTNQGRCDTQPCRSGGGFCKYSDSRRRCYMNKMRGKNVHVGCQFCKCIVA
ncbi:hypothetical protein BJ912DRAFT_851955 [Pholiota molesta]|nr:hypothetical protein BJ912DRAFT_851955 [Pholiota molesta]